MYFIPSYFNTWFITWLNFIHVHCTIGNAIWINSCITSSYALHRWDINKQCEPRWDAAKSYSVWSGPTLFCLNVSVGKISCDIVFIMPIWAERPTGGTYTCANSADQDGAPHKSCRLAWAYSVCWNVNVGKISRDIVFIMPIWIERPKCGTYTWTDSAGPDEASHTVALDLGLHCLLKWQCWQN